MGRRSKTSPLEGITDLISRLPCWAGVAIAVVGYFGLHRYATSPAPPGDIPGLMFRGLATGGQYLVPLMGLVGAVVSAVRGYQRRKLVSNVTGSQSADALNGMGWREFEVLVAEGFRLQGYRVEETGAGGADGGVDLVLSRPGANGTEKFLVQCKQWRAYKVGVDVVRELYGVMAARGTAGGFVVTSGRFTDETTAFAQGRNVRLVDGTKLFGLIRQAEATRRSATVVAKAAAPAERPEADRAPACPLCRGAMVRRVAKRGAAAGNAFWGCAAYPNCRGIRQL